MTLFGPWPGGRPMRALRVLSGVLRADRRARATARRPRWRRAGAHSHTARDCALRGRAERDAGPAAVRRARRVRTAAPHGPAPLGAVERPLSGFGFPTVNLLSMASLHGRAGVSAARSTALSGPQARGLDESGAYVACGADARCWVVMPSYPPSTLLDAFLSGDACPRDVWLHRSGWPHCRSVLPV